jgi:hypothetical protein
MALNSGESRMAARGDGLRLATLGVNATEIGVLSYYSTFIGQE